MFGLSAYTLLLPTLTQSGWLDPQWLTTGPFGIDWLRPHALFGLAGWDPLTHGTFWSLLLNVGALLLVSARCSLEHAHLPSLPRPSRAARSGSLSASPRAVRWTA